MKNLFYILVVVLSIQACKKEELIKPQSTTHYSRPAANAKMADDNLGNDDTSIELSNIGNSENGYTDICIGKGDVDNGEKDKGTKSPISTKK